MATGERKRTRPSNPNLGILAGNLAAEAASMKSAEGNSETVNNAAAAAVHIEDTEKVSGSDPAVPAEVPEAPAAADEPAQDSSPAGSAQAAQNRGGRPRKARERLVVYMEPAVYDAVRRFGFENRRTYSDVMNALAAQYLDKLDPDTVEKK